MSEDKNVKQKGFWKGMKSELKKVIWPTGEQTVKSTFATIAFVFMVSIVLIVFNLFFYWLNNLWIRSLSHEDIIDNVVISGDNSEINEGNDNSEEMTVNGEELSGEAASTGEELSETIVETSGE